MYSNIVLYLTSAILLTTSSLAQENHPEHHAEHKVNVDVYYESLCPDSKSFINNQLYVTIQNANLSKYINLTLIPSGKTTAEKVSDTDYKFTCHHGPQECLGNKLHACALTEIKSTKESDKLGNNNKIQAGFVACLMKMAETKDNKTEFKINDCATMNHVNNVGDIESCAHHTMGTEKLYAFYEKTKALQPPLTSVPTIVFNGKFKAEDSKLAQENFVKALCKHIQDEKPIECKGSGASSLHMNVAFMTVLMTFVLRYFY